MNESIYELRVSRAASGAYPTISDALAATDQLYPDAEQAVTIHIDPGEYRERVEIHRPHVTLAGETADSVRIVGSLGAKMPSEDGSGVDGTLGTFRTYTVLVDADDVRLENLTIVNDAGDGREVGQAIALYADGDRLVVDACCITGRQDTLFLGPLPPREVKPGGFMGPKQFAPRRVGRQYFRRCRIEGDVDFIFGGARAYFEGCEIRSLNRDMDVNGYVTAASTPEGEPYGFVFHGCSFTAPDDVAPDSVYLGRPWREWAQTVLIDCWLGQHIKREGWWDWNKPAAHERARYVGTSLHGPAGDAAGWAPWTRELDATAAARYAREQVLAGADGWDPEGGDGDAVETASLSDSGRTVHIDIYYEDEPALRDRLKREGRSAAFKGATPVTLKHGKLRRGIGCLTCWAYRLWIARQSRCASSIECRLLAVSCAPMRCCRWSATFGCRSTYWSRRRQARCARLQALLYLPARPPGRRRRKCCGRNGRAGGRRCRTQV